MSIYRGSFGSVEDVVSAFCIELSDLQGVEILLAEYDTGDYEGEAWVIFKKDGQLFEVNGSHCSCYGLEDQWEPQLTTAKALFMRPKLEDDTELSNLLLELHN